MTDEPRTGDAPRASPSLRAPPPRPKRPLWRTLLWVAVVVVIAIYLAARYGLPGVSPARS